MSKIKLEDIQQIITTDNWKLLSTEYNNLDTEMIFECAEGHKVYAPWKKIRTRRECPICKANNLASVNCEILPKPANTQRVLTLDQASHTSGYAIFDNGKLIKYGTFVTSAENEIARLSAIKTWLLSMITNWKPDYIGLEGIQYQDEASGQKMGITVFQTLARLQGILMETCYAQKIEYTVCPTNTWRHACGVKGKSRIDRKRSMQLLVKQWYDVSISDDEADAIGIGYYLTHKIDTTTKIENWEI